jgi:hypothetical protein
MYSLEFGESWLQVGEPTRSGRLGVDRPLHRFMLNGILLSAHGREIVLPRHHAILSLRWPAVYRCVCG